MKFTDVLEQNNQVIVYGAGDIARILYRYMEQKGLQENIKAFVVNDKSENADSLFGISIVDYREFIDSDLTIIMGVWHEKQDEIIKDLTNDGISKARIVELNKEIINTMRICVLSEEFDSAAYWDNRYINGGNSGSGSYNRLAEFKAKILNDFCKKKDIKKVIEWGSGDGNQLKYAKYPEYLGYDVSNKAIEICSEMYKEDTHKRFICSKDLDEDDIEKAELVISLDVIYHLVEDEAFTLYMNRLFRSSDRFVIIYSSNYDKIENVHVKHRKFTDWIDLNLKDQWKQIDFIKNEYQYDYSDRDNTTYSDFYIYEKI